MIGTSSAARPARRLIAVALVLCLAAALAGAAFPALSAAKPKQGGGHAPKAEILVPKRDARTAGKTLQVRVRDTGKAAFSASVSGTDVTGRFHRHGNLLEATLRRGRDYQVGENLLAVTVGERAAPAGDRPIRLPEAGQGPAEGDQARRPRHRSAALPHPRLGAGCRCEGRGQRRHLSGRRGRRQARVDDRDRRLRRRPLRLQLDRRRRRARGQQALRSRTSSLPRRPRCTIGRCRLRPDHPHRQGGRPARRLDDGGHPQGIAGLPLEDRRQTVRVPRPDRRRHQSRRPLFPDLPGSYKVRLVRRG